jgi:hypothetical protein
MGIDFSTEVRQASTVFTQYRNTINIYTEDCDKDKKFYVTLLKRLLNDTNVIINDIYPLGNCTNVINACRKDKDTSPKLYIIDGDIYNMSTPRDTEENLFVLDSYCIENYVIDEQAYYKVYNELDPVHGEEEIRKIVNYSAMMEEAIAPFMRLFRYFSISKEVLDKFRLKSATCFLSNIGNIEISKIDDETANIKVQLEDGGLSEQELSKAIKEKDLLFPDCYENLLKYVSGKDYLIPYICGFSENKLSLSLGLRKEHWKYHYSKFCKLDRLEKLKTAIIDATR